MIKHLIFVIAFLCCGMTVKSQTTELEKIIKDRGFYMPHVQWLMDDGRMETYIRSMDRVSTLSMQKTLDNMNYDHERAMKLLNERKDILGEKLVAKLDGKPSRKIQEKQDKILSEKFKDIEMVKTIFEKAGQVERRYGRLSSIIKSHLEKATPRVMPKGKLMSFDYSTSNGFAGYHEEVTLQKKDGKNLLRVEEKRMRDDFDKPQETPYDVEVDDSVFTRVRDMVEQGKLYEIGDQYMPDYEIMDASNWSLDFTFEGGSISSSGYAAGPDHSSELGQIMRYLFKLYDDLKPKDEQKDEQK